MPRPSLEIPTFTFAELDAHKCRRVLRMLPCHSVGLNTSRGQAREDAGFKTGCPGGGGFSGMEIGGDSIKTSLARISLYVNLRQGAMLRTHGMLNIELSYYHNWSSRWGCSFPSRSYRSTSCKCNS
jgi:hypothetical protein